MNLIHLENTSIQHAEDLVFWAGQLRELSHEQQTACIILTDAWGSSQKSLESLVSTFFDSTELAFKELEDIRSFYLKIADSVLPSDFIDKNQVIDEISNTLVEVEWLLEEGPLDAFDYVFDQIVSVGPMLASKVLCAYLKAISIPCAEMDARNFMMTDNLHCMAKLDKNSSIEAIQKQFSAWNENSFGSPAKETEEWIVSQNGIGSTSENFTTTFGPKGRDLTIQTLGRALNIQCYGKAKSRTTCDTFEVINLSAV